MIIIDDFLTDEECNELAVYVISFKRSQKILKEQTSFTMKFAEKHFEKLVSHGFTKMYTEVTIGHSRNLIGKHIDKKMNDSTHKLLIYLNDVEEGGGTQFYGDSPLLIEHKKGRAVIFDITLEHSGEKVKGFKTTIGFRLK